MEHQKHSSLDAQINSEVQTILAEKRTALSGLQTGIAIFALPLSVFSVLIVTSKYYHTSEVLHWLILIGILCLGLISLAVYLIVRALRRIHACDRLIDKLKRKHSVLAEFVI